MANAPDTMSNDPLVGRTFAGQYTIEKMIGRGGMGRVYLADQRTPPAKVVVKVLAPDWADDPEAVARFEREAERLSEISHSNIVELFDYGHEAGISFIVMEFVDGLLLSDYLDGAGPLAPDQAVPIMAQVLKGTGYAHSRELMLRDIKPENVMLCEHKGRAHFVKMLDFGLAKLVQDQSNITKQNVMGTANYMAPEAIKGGDIDLRVDVYALGVLFYRMLAGKLPFTAESDTAILYKHVNEPPPPLSEHLPAGAEVPDGLLELIHDCLAKNREDRPHDANAIVERLIDCVPLSMFRLPRADGGPSTGQSITGRITGIHEPQRLSDLTASTPPLSGTGSRLPPTGSRSPLADAAAPSDSHLPLVEPAPKSKLPLILAGVGALALVGVFFATRGDTGETKPGKTPVASQDPGPTGADAQALLAEAQTAFADKQLDAALSKLDEVAAASPDASTAGQAENLRGRVEIARLMAAATQLEAKGELPAALATYKEVLKADTANADARSAIGRIEAAMTEKPPEENKDEGKLVVVSVPIAHLFIDGKPAGDTPYAGTLPFGMHDIRLEADGYDFRKGSVDILRSGNEPLEFTLRRKTAQNAKKKRPPRNPDTSGASTDEGGTGDAPKPDPKTEPATSDEGGDSPFIKTKKKKKSGVFLPVGEN